MTKTFVYFNSWDIEVDQGGKAVLHGSGLPGVDKKVPDSAPDFGYTHDAHHAVTGARGGRRSSLGPRWFIGGSPISGRYPGVPAEN